MPVRYKALPDFPAYGKACCRVKLIYWLSVGGYAGAAIVQTGICWFDFLAHEGGA